MEMITLILALSSVMWYIIERGKTEIWGNFSFSKWVTIGVAAIAGFGLTFAFGLDIIYACYFTDTVTVAGQIITAFALMAGSSAVSEIIDRIKK